MEHCLLMDCDNTVQITDPGSRLPRCEDEATDAAHVACGLARLSPQGPDTARSWLRPGHGGRTPQSCCIHNLDASPTLGLGEEVAALVCQGNLLTSSRKMAFPHMKWKCGHCQERRDKSKVVLKLVPL